MYDLEQILKAIPPGECTYDEWLRIGMALFNEGCSCDVWDSWSQADDRYKPGECASKWQTFSDEADQPVTGGTIVGIARDKGIGLAGEQSLNWDDELAASTAGAKNAISTDPSTWNPAEDALEFLDAAYNDDDSVAYITEFYDKDGKITPGKPIYRSVAEMKARLRQCDDVGAAIGDNDIEGGALISVNPMDGKGRKTENVTDLRHALIECDTGSIDEQFAKIQELNLPCATVVHSGNKSVHALVRVDACDRKEYASRVKYLYDYCAERGLEVDTANKNPSRFTRFPGYMRNGNPQALIATNIGARSWGEWMSWSQAQIDNLPPTVNLEDALANLPELAPELIEGVLRQGHKMILAGPSKAGKTFALMGLAVSVGEGACFLGYPCKRGKVLYINLEVDERSCQHRFAAIYEKRGLDYDSASNIDLLNLRGHAGSLDKLAVQIVNRAKKKGRSPEEGGYSLIIIDPIYKVLGGDENAASDTSRFCNALDFLCSELGCSIAFVHHHSKGSQGQKSSIDRSSGSGVFARDPDAILDLSPLRAEKSQLEVPIQEELRRLVKQAMEDYGVQAVADDVELAIEEIADQLGQDDADAFLAEVDAVKSAQTPTAWRLSMTLREFASPDPSNLWFHYPLHILDEDGVLDDCFIPGEHVQHAGREERQGQLESAFDQIADGGDTADIQEVALVVGKSPKTIQRWVDESNVFTRAKGRITKTFDEDADISD